jgi:hypothetical protein
MADIGNVEVTRPLDRVVHDTVYKFIVIKVKCGMWMANCRSTLAVGNEQL